MIRHKGLTSMLLGALALAATAAGAAETPANTHASIRGTVNVLSGNTLKLTDVQGKPHTATLNDQTRISGVSKGDISDIKPNSFIGTAAKLQPDGTLKALEVHVFDPSLRGTGEGFRPWQGADGQTATMTNGTVGTLVNANGRVMTVKYGNSEKKVLVPDGVPVVSLTSGDRSLLKPGAHIILFPAPSDAGTPLVAGRIIAGIKGTVPPM